MKVSAKPGFTLVELLVVILIIVVIATLSFTLLPKMLAKGKAVKQAQNMRQMGPLFAMYAADHQMRLPAAKAKITQPDQPTKEEDLYWTETLLATLHPDTDPAEFKKEAWWESNDNLKSDRERNDYFMSNPLFKKSAKPRGWTPLNPGYGLNEMIAENLAKASTGSAPAHEELDKVSTLLADVSEPSRTPLVAPSDNYFFRYDQAELAGFNSGTLKDFLTNGKVPILFVDGHVESLNPSEYLRRKLYLMPIAPTP